MRKPHARLFTLSSFLLSLLLASCSGGGHGGGGGGGGTPRVDLFFQIACSTSSVTLIAGSSGTVNFVVQNTGRLGTSSATTVTMSLASSSGVTFSSGGDGTSGWNCGASTITVEWRNERNNLERAEFPRPCIL